MPSPQRNQLQVMLSYASRRTDLARGRSRRRRHRDASHAGEQSDTVSGPGVAIGFGLTSARHGG